MMITPTKNKSNGIENKMSSACCQIVRAVDVDESDEERELTNLNWLLRNQNLTWPKTINSNLEDDIHAIQSGNTELSNDSENKKKHKLADNNTPKTMTNKYLKQNLVMFPESKTKTTTAHSKRPSPAERYDIFINKIKRDMAEYEKLATKYKTDVSEKPPFNYSHIIGMAMLENGRATLQQICTWIETKFAFFRVRKKWNNSIRHNLSLHHCFRNRKREDKGKGGYWELGVDPKKCDRKRIRNRKTTQTKSNQNLETTKREKPSTINESNQACYDGMAAGNNNVQSEQAEQSLNLNEINRDMSLGLTLPNVNILSPRVRDSDGTFLNPDDLTMSLTTNLQQQYELGTIIISTTTGIIDEPTCLNNIISSKFGCTNTIYTEAEIPSFNENEIVISSSHSTFDSPTAINCDFSNFRPYINDVDESFNYSIHCNEINQNEDVLDNLLDVCVRDY